MNSKPIGIFDSGLGGLTVLKEIKSLLPKENIVYFGDTARLPYGNKSKSTIIKFSTESILFLLKERVKLVVVACNTSSSLALGHLKNIFKIPIIGVIEAGADKALTISKKRRVGVIGTRSTIESKSYQSYLRRKDKGLKVFSKACPLFVPLVEEGLRNGPLVRKTLSLYLDTFKKSKVDALILGCTHYPLLKKPIASFLKNTIIIDSAKEVAKKTREVLINSNLERGANRKGLAKYFVTDDGKSFSQLANLFLKETINKPRRVNV